MKRICLLIILAICAMSVFSAPDYMKGDSVGTKEVQGNAYIIYKVSGGETIYAVSRKFGISYASIVSANPGVDMNAVKAGQQILVPAHSMGTSAYEQRQSGSVNTANNGDAMTRIEFHTVSAGETIYSIARKYNMGVTDLMAVNPEIKNYAIKTGQKIKIPAADTNEATAETVKQQPEIVNSDKVVTKGEPVKEEKTAVITTTETTGTVEIQEKKGSATKTVAENKDEPVAEINHNDDPEISSSTLPVTDKNKPFSSTFAEYAYNSQIVSASEKGVATWIEGSNDLSTQNERYYALHNEAPIGSVIKIRNLMNNRVIYAKVIGTLSEDEVNQKVMVKLSAGAAQKLNVLDNRFVVEATYFEAKDSSTSAK